MKRVYLAAILGIGVLALAGCRGGGEIATPEVKATAVSAGEDLQLTWKSVENADGYRVYCDDNKIWEGKDTTHTIDGASRVCKEVQVSAYSGDDEQKYTLDLTPKPSGTITLVSHDSPSGNSWVKLDFNSFTVTPVRQSDVDKTAPKVGWFVFFNNSGNPEFRDARETSVGQAEMEMAFTESSSGNLAPGTGNYNTVRRTSANAYHFFWADNRSTYGSMDNNDYFGVIKVADITGTGPYTVNLEIYIQHKVPGLRWVKF